MKLSISSLVLVFGITGCSEFQTDTLNKTLSIQEELAIVSLVVEFCHVMENGNEFRKIATAAFIEEGLAQTPSEATKILNGFHEVLCF
jgi:anaerobic glycerol-3-phosphate dehydrogenase